MNSCLPNSKLELENLLHQLPYLVAKLDMEQRHHWINDAYGNFVNAVGKDILGEDLKTVLSDVHYQALKSSINRVKEGKPSTFILAGQESNGHKYHGRLLPNHSADGEQNGFWIFADDISNYTEFEAELHGALIGTIKCLSEASEVRDPYTADHQKKVSNISVLIAEELGESPRFREGIYFGSLIHDLGKIYIPQEILSRSGKITNEEFALIRTHAVVGHKIIKDAKFPWPISDMVVQHHERLDGTGYPAGLKGDEIIKEARILAVADVVEAMSSHRPYRPALGIERALDEILANRGKKYDPEIADACIRVMEDAPVAA